MSAIRKIQASAPITDYPTTPDNGAGPFAVRLIHEFCDGDEIYQVTRPFPELWHPRPARREILLACDQYAERAEIFARSILSGVSLFYGVDAAITPHPGGYSMPYLKAGKTATGSISKLELKQSLKAQWSAMERTARLCASAV